MSFGDVLVEDGKAREAEFKSKYGEDKVLFVKCDVAKKEDVDGKCFDTCYAVTKHRR